MASTEVPPLHPALTAVARLLGTWSGTGRGEYPTIEPFEYLETITFGHVGKPFLAYQQRTRSTGEPAIPMHAESGYWRCPVKGRVEVVLVHPTGIVEIEEGTIEPLPGSVTVIDLKAQSVQGTTSAKEVTAIERTFELDGDVLSYRVRMAAVGQRLQHHLAATLTRQPA